MTLTKLFWYTLLVTFKVPPILSQVDHLSESATKSAKTKKKKQLQNNRIVSSVFIPFVSLSL